MQNTEEQIRICFCFICMLYLICFVVVFFGKKINLSVFNLLSFSTNKVSRELTCFCSCCYSMGLNITRVSCEGHGLFPFYLLAFLRVSFTVSVKDDSCSRFQITLLSNLRNNGCYTHSIFITQCSAEFYVCVVFNQRSVN